MPCLHLRLDEWRAAERRRDGTTPGTPARLEAEEDVRRARSRYQFESDMLKARYPAPEEPRPVEVDVSIRTVEAMPIRPDLDGRPRSAVGRCLEPALPLPTR